MKMVRHSFFSTKNVFEQEVELFLFCYCSAVLLFFLFIYLLCVSFKPGFIIFVNLHLEAATRSSSQVFNPLNRCEC